MKEIILLLVTISLLSSNLAAQVTIGSDLRPKNGALLDLKQKDNNTGGPTAEKGLGMPRMDLLVTSGDLGYTMRYATGSLDA